MRSTDEEAGLNSQATFSNKLLHMDTPVLSDHQMLIFIISAGTLGTMLRAYQE